MATKRQGVACYDKAGQDEPLFVLRAQDVLAAPTVRFWAALAAGGGTDPQVIQEAFDCADQMEAWNFHKWPGTSKIRHQPDQPVEGNS